MEGQIFKISDFANYLKNYIEDSKKFKNINVKGEVANLTHNKSGHIYFSLKDFEAKIDCAIWKTNAFKFTDLNIKEGTEIVAKGTISYYKPTGKLTFTVVDIKIEGIGELALLYEKRFKELKEKGWFLEEFKKSIPKFPNNIGIVTAPTGDAIRDLISTIKRRYPPVNIFLFSSLVQGDDAAKDIAKKIKQANNFEKKIDVLIVGRGGGSYEDLWSFNELEVLNAVRESQIPVISGIGHEPDFTLTDFISDFRASTPTAAGEKATPDFENVLFALTNKTTEFAKILKNKIEQIGLELKNYELNFKNNINLKIEKININFKNITSNFNSTIKNKINFIKHSLDNNFKDWKRLLDIKLEKNKNEIKNFEDIIELQNPFLPLSKGYSILKQNNKVIKNISEIDKGKIINAILNDGEINLQIEKVK